MENSIVDEHFRALYDSLPNTISQNFLIIQRVVCCHIGLF